MQTRLFSIDTALLTQRTVTRRFREHEGEQFLELVRSSHDFLYDHYPLLPKQVGETIESAEAFLRYRIAAWLVQEEFTFGIWENESTELIGYVHLGTIDWRLPSAQLSFFIKPIFSGQGFMTEVIARVLRFAFLQLGMEKLYFKVVADNYRGQRLARKVGFSREGDLRNEFRRGSGLLVDVTRFGLSRETYGE